VQQGGIVVVEMRERDGDVQAGPRCAISSQWPQSQARKVVPMTCIRFLTLTFPLVA
jgi:hypothetical protein